MTAGPVYNIDDILEDPHFAARDIIVEAEDAELGSVAMHNFVPRLSATPGTWRRPAPTLGEHTEEVLLQAGYNRAAIVQLREEGAAQ